MKIFNIFSVIEPFKTGASGSGLGVPYTIQYNMSVMGTELDGTRYIRNYGKGGNSFNAEAFASNHIFLADPQNVPYAITGGTSVAYYDVATKSFVTDTASNPYIITVPHSVLFSYTSVLEDIDKAALNADPDLAFRMFFEGEILPSGFSRANNMADCNFYGGNEGLASADYVQDLSVDLGSENIVNGTFPTDVADWIVVRVDIAWEEANKAKLTRNDTGSAYIEQTQTLEIGKLYLFSTKFEVGTVTAGTFELNIFTDSWGTDWTNGAPSVAYSALGNGIVQGWFIPTTTSVKFLVISEGSNLNEYFFVGDISTREASAVEIQDYDSATRTTLANQSYGASNLKSIQDSSGRTTGTAATNTTQWEADGRTAVTNWTISAPFTITEDIDGDTYDFTSDGNRYKNTVADGTYTLPTGIWTLDEFGFDGATSVTARGVTRMIDEVVIP